MSVVGGGSGEPTAEAGVSLGKSVSAPHGPPSSFRATILYFDLLPSRWRRVCDHGVSMLHLPSYRDDLSKQMSLWATTRFGEVDKGFTAYTGMVET